jgi:hypothetical protein
VFLSFFALEQNIEKKSTRLVVSWKNQPEVKYVRSLASETKGLRGRATRKTVVPERFLTLTFFLQSQTNGLSLV